MDDDQEAMNPSRRQQQPVSLGGGGTRHVQFGGGVVDSLGSQGHRGGQRSTAGRGVGGGLDLGVGLSNRQGTASVLGIGPSQHQVKVSDLFINYWTWAMDLRCILWLAGSCNGDQPGNKPESATGNLEAFLDLSNWTLIMDCSLNGGTQGFTASSHLGLGQSYQQVKLELFLDQGHLSGFITGQSGGRQFRWGRGSFGSGSGNGPFSIGKFWTLDPGLIRTTGRRRSLPG